MDGTTSDELIARVRNGDDEAFGQLWMGIHKRIMGFIRSRVLNDDDAEDVMQDVSLCLIRRFEEYDSTLGDLETFVIHFCARRAIDRYWKKLPHSIPLEDMGSIKGETAVGSPESMNASTSTSVDLYRFLLSDLFDGDTVKPHQALCYAYGILWDWGDSDLLCELTSENLRDIPSSPRTIGESTLRNYAEQKSTLSNWNHRVRRRIFKAFARKHRLPYKNPPVGKKGSARVGPVFDKLGHIPLKTLWRYLEKDYRRRSGLPHSLLDDCFAAFPMALDRPFTPK